MAYSGFTALEEMQNGQLATGYGDGAIRIWSLDTVKRSLLGVGNSQCIKTLKGHTSRIEALTKRSNGTLVSCARDGIRVWDIEKEKCLTHIKYNYCYRGYNQPLIVTDDDLILVRSYLIDNITVYIAAMYHPETGEQIRILRGHSDEITSIVKLPFGRLATGSLDGSVRIWNAKEAKYEKIYNYGTAISSLALFPDYTLAVGTTHKRNYVGSSTVRITSGLRTATAVIPDVQKTEKVAMINIIDLESGEKLNNLIHSLSSCPNSLKLLKDGHIIILPVSSFLHSWQVPLRDYNDHRDIRLIIDALKNNTSVEKLNFSNLRLREEIVNYLGAVLACSLLVNKISMKEIDLSNTGITTVGAKNLYEYLQSSSISIKLDGNNIASEVLEDFKRMNSASTNICKEAEEKLEKNNLTEALVLFDKAINLDEKNPRAWFGRGNVKNSLKLRNEAINDFTQVLKLNSKHQKAYTNRGVAKYALGQYQNAIDDYSKALEMDQKARHVHYNRALARHDLGLKNRDLNLIQDSLKDYLQALELDPKNPLIYYWKAEANNSLKLYEAALKDYDSAIQLHPTYTTAYYNRANTKVSLKDYVGAKNDYENAIKLRNGNYKEAVSALEVLEKKMKESTANSGKEEILDLDFNS